MFRIIALFLSLLALAWSPPALAEVKASFHSFNGSVLFGRYPHTFVVFEGTLDDGTVVNENYGFTAKKVSPAILSRPVAHEVISEPAKYVKKTNRHFTITITDQKYRAMVAEMKRWRDAPGDYYDLDKRNCIHFVGKMLTMVGVKVDYPKKMLRRPKKWLNHITAMNPQLGAQQIK